MKIIPPLLLAAILSCSAYAADTLPVFNATLTVGKESRFVLIGHDGKASSFLQIGDTFEGYTIKSYDAKAATLTLEKDGRSSEVALASDAATANGPAKAVPPALADAENVLNKMHFEEILGKAVDRQTKMVTATFDQQMKRMAAAGISPADAAAFREKMLGEIKSIMDPTTLKDDLTKIYQQVFTKDELDGMAAFYSTPLGETVANKQADVQEKIGGIIQQRMMEAMPRMQQLQRELGQKMQAAKAAAAAASAGTAPAAPAAPAAKP
jgi:hypothetical protein